MRAKSKNLQGGISGKMRKNLAKVMDVINTLILKVEEKDDPAKLRLNNITLKREIGKLEVEETLRKRETEDMRIMMDTPDRGGGIKE